MAFDVTSRDRSGLDARPTQAEQVLDRRIVSLFRGQVLLGIILIVLAFVVGPGGYSIFK